MTLLPCLSVLLCVSISTGSLSLSLSFSALWFVASLCFLPPEKVVLRNMSGFASLSLFCQDACYPAVERSPSLSVSCFLPIYFSPPSHIQKSKTNRPPTPPPTITLFPLPLLVSVKLPSCPHSSSLSFVPRQNVLNKSHSTCQCSPFLHPPFLLFLTLSSLPLSTLRPLL